MLDPREEEKAAAEEEERGPAVAGSFRLLLSTPVMLLACLVTVVTGMSTQWYQPSLEPYVRTQFGMSPFQVRTIIFGPMETSKRVQNTCHITVNMARIS